MGIFLRSPPPLQSKGCVLAAIAGEGKINCSYGIDHVERDLEEDHKEPSLINWWMIWIFQKNILLLLWKTDNIGKKVMAIFDQSRPDDDDDSRESNKAAGGFSLKRV